jgi:hypothetical protein
MMEFQTPPIVCDYMAGLVNLPFGPNSTTTLLEPTPGEGNLVVALRKKGYNKIIAPDDFWNLRKDGWLNTRIDCVVMNPPFSPATEGYRFLDACMEMSQRIIALMPWWTIINSEKRLHKILTYGLVSVTHLPRRTFPGSRIQCCVLVMDKTKYISDTKFLTFVGL